MPKAPLRAQITIVLLAVLAIVYSASAIHLSEATAGKRYAVPGQVVVVRLSFALPSLQSSDEAVVKPISVSLTPTTTGYFIALKPGKARLEGGCTRCMTLIRGWSVEVEVRPG